MVLGRILTDAKRHAFAIARRETEKRGFRKGSGKVTRKISRTHRPPDTRQGLELRRGRETGAAVGDRSDSRTGTSSSPLRCVLAGRTEVQYVVFLASLLSGAARVPTHSVIEVARRRGADRPFEQNPTSRAFYGRGLDVSAKSPNGSSRTHRRALSPSSSRLFLQLMTFPPALPSGNP